LRDVRGLAKLPMSRVTSKKPFTTDDLPDRFGPAADIIASECRILLVAINPSPRSTAANLPFASPSNVFWRLLFASGLIPVPLRPADAGRLPEFGLGLTSVANRATPMASDVSIRERREGAVRVREIVSRVRPQVVALLGPTLAPLFLRPDERTGVGWKKTRIGTSRVFVLPNPSGRNRAYPGFRAKLVWYRRLARDLPVKACGNHREADVAVSVARHSASRRRSRRI
jgi:double-stranded uracil-DNA glycosylase